MGGGFLFTFLDSPSKSYMRLSLIVILLMCSLAANGQRTWQHLVA